MAKSIKLQKVKTDTNSKPVFKKAPIIKPTHLSLEQIVPKKAIIRQEKTTVIQERNKLTILKPRIVKLNPDQVKLYFRNRKNPQKGITNKITKLGKAHPMCLTREQVS